MIKWDITDMDLRSKTVELTPKYGTVIRREFMIKNRSGLQGTIFSDKATSSVREMTLVGPINRSNTFQHIPTLNLQFLRLKKLPKRLYNLSAWWA